MQYRIPIIEPYIINMITSSFTIKCLFLCSTCLLSTNLFIYLFNCLHMMKNFTVLEPTKPNKSYVVQYYKQTLKISLLMLFELCIHDK